MQIDSSSTSSEIQFHGLPSKSKRPGIRKQIALLLSSQLIVLLFLRNSHLQKDIQQTFLRQYFCQLLENSCSASKKTFRKSLESSQKAPVAKSYFSKVEGFYRSSYRRCSVKSGVFRKRFAQNSQENTCVRDYFIKVAGLKLWKKTLTQVFSCEFSEISKNSFCKEYLRTTASAFSFSEAATGSVL